MSPEDQAYYDDQFDMFSGDGWKHIQKNVKQLEEIAHSKQDTAEDWGKTMYWRGIREAYGWFMNYQEIIENGYEQAQSTEETVDADL